MLKIYLKTISILFKIYFITFNDLIHHILDFKMLQIETKAITIFKIYLKLFLKVVLITFVSVLKIGFK